MSPIAVQSRFLSCLLLCASVSACGGYPRPKISRIDTTVSTPSDTSRLSAEIFYRDGLLDFGNWLQGDELLFKGDFFYFDDTLLTLIQSVDGQGTLIRNQEFIYQSGELIQTSVTDGEHDEVWEVEFDDGRLSDVSVTDYRGSQAIQGRRLYEYEDDGRLLNIALTTGMQQTNLRLRYDDDQRIEEIDHHSALGSRKTAFFYDVDGQLDRVTDPDGRRFELFYVDGRISQVESYPSPDVTVTTTYTYTDGDVVGMIPTAAYPYSEYFDIEGRRLERVELTAFDFFGG